MKNVFLGIFFSIIFILYAQANPLYNAQISVDVSSTNVAEAKKQALNEATRKGLNEVILAISTQETVDEINKLNDNQIQHFISGIQVLMEKSSPIRYIADLKIEVNKDVLTSFIKENNLKPNMLINNAGYILEGSVLGCKEEEIYSCHKVNIEGTMDITYWFLNNADKENRRYVLFVSSMAGYYPMPQMATYGATKSFLTHMAVALRQELKGQNVYVSAVCPGSMATNDAMKRSIKSQGVGGRLSLQSTEKVARVSIKKVLKNKATWVPGLFNKIMVFCAKVFPKTLIAKVVYARWTKCEKKRGEYR